ncbi:MAG TPA: hypothetical protein VGG56_17830 [Terracidiphilus sp.]|jgi:hypothetical protein
MKTRYIVTSALALSLGMFGFNSTKALSESQAPGPPPPGYQQAPGGWDQPPAEFREFQRKGFHDGVEGARQDFKHHRTPDPANRDEFHHPHVPHDMREDYRDGFRRGYETAMRHLTNNQHPY